MNRTWLIALLAVGISFLLHSQCNASNTLIGILEDDRLELVNWKKGPSKKRVIRPLFQKKGGEWVISTSHSEEINWTIAFDGKTSGSVRSIPNPEKIPFNKDVHVPKPQPDQSLILGKPSEDFSGWQNTLFNRPLVLVSNGSSKDPDGWKSFSPTEAQVRLFKSKFRSEYTKVKNCNENEEPLPNPWPYKDTDIKLLKGYMSNKGALLINMYLEGGKCGINRDPFTAQLFLFRPDMSSTHIVARSNKNRPVEAKLSLTLVDAGDYDDDGKSEVIFFVSGYNEDGYAIYYDSFRKNVSWTWSYH
jgi:hypothetical protein